MCRRRRRRQIMTKREEGKISQILRLSRRAHVIVVARVCKCKHRQSETWNSDKESERASQAGQVAIKAFVERETERHEYHMQTERAHAGMSLRKGGDDS